MARMLKLLCVSLLITAPVEAQTITASLEGVVRDASGGAIQHAEVTVVNAGTNATFKTKTDAEGRFLALSLRPGSHSVTVEKAGFRKLERTGITLQVNQAARLDLVLEVGTQDETLTITATAPLLEATTSAVGQVIDNKQIVDLPLNARNPFDLVRLVPGVIGGSSFNPSTANTFSVNGGRPQSNEILIDGIPSAPSNDAVNTPSVFPSVDAVQEFRLQTNSFSAEFGRSGGGVINLIYKSGTNQFRGSAFEFYRDAAFDEQDYFAERQGQALADSSRHQFGATLGGPIKRDKTFFFLNYEGLRERRAVDQFLTVPTEAMRRGDFSQLRRAGQPIVIYDPLTTTGTTAATVSRLPFPGNLIPQSRFDPVAVRALRYFPLPNVAGAEVFNNYFIATEDPFDTDEMLVKLDHRFSNRQQLAVRYAHRRHIDKPARLLPDEIAFAQRSRNFNFFGHNVALDYNLTASPTFLVNFRYGFARQAADFSPLSLGFDPVAELGLPAYIRDIPTGNGEPLVFPNLVPAGYLAVGGADIGSGDNPFMVHTWQLGLTKVASRHLLKFGGEVRWFLQNTSQYGRTTGHFDFGAGFTQANPLAPTANTGDGFASFLLGMGNTGSSLTEGFKTSHNRSSYWAGYVNDDWKVSSKLTLNLGLRYEVEIPRVEVLNRTNFFDKDAPHPLGPQIQGRPGVELCPACKDLRGGLVFVGVNGVSRRGIETDWNNLSPRAGFAYQVDPRTVIRGGYALIYAPSPHVATGTIGQTGFRSDTPWLGTLDNGLTPNHLLRNPFPDGPVPRPGSSLGLNTALGLGMQALQPESVGSPYTQHWNLGIQRELPGAVLFDAAYVGHRGVHLIDSSQATSINEVRPEFWSPALTQLVPNPFFDPATGRSLIPVGVFARPTIARGRLVRPFPHFDGISHVLTTGASAIYHSLQVKSERRFKSGLGFLMAYTWGKLIDDNTGVGTGVPSSGTIQTQYNRRAERAVSPSNVAHQVVAAYTYELPFGREKAIGKSWGGAVDAILGGWQVNGITTFRTGTPLTISAPNNCTNCFNGGLRPNINPGAPADLKMPGNFRERWEADPRARYFDTSVFSQPTAYTLGNAPRTLKVLGPGLVNTDLSLFKNFRPSGRFTVQLRVEAYNVFNYVQFPQPNTAFAVNSTTFGTLTNLNQANTPRQLQFGAKLLF